MCNHTFVEEIKWKFIKHNFIPILVYGINSFYLKNDQMQKISAAFYIAVRRYFEISGSSKCIM